MRRVARALLIAVGALLGLVVAAVLGLLIYLHTDWGRETVRRITEKQLSKLITGRVEMGPITGSVVTRFTVHGLVVRDQYGAEVLRVKEVHADWSPLALLRKRVRVHSGVVIGAVVTGRRDAAGRLTFAFDRLWRAKAEEHLRPPRPPRPPGEKTTPWLVDLDGLRLAGALFVIPGKSGGTTSVASVTVEGELFVIAPGLERFDVARASGVWLERGLPIAVHGTMIRSASLVALSGVEVVAGGSRITLPLGMLRPDGGRAVLLSATVREADAFPFWPHPLRLGDVTIDGTLIRRDGRPPVDARLKVRALGGELRVAAAGSLDEPGIHGELSGQGLVSPFPSVPATADLDGTFSLTGGWHGKARVTARGTLYGREVDDVEVDATLNRGLLRGDLTAVVARARVAASFALHLGVLGESFAIDARVRAKTSDVGSLAGRRDLRGDLDLDGRLHVGLRTVSVSGKARSRELRLGDHRAGNLIVGFDLTGIPGDPRGSVDVDAEEVVAGGQSLGHLGARGQLPGGRVADVTLEVSGADRPYTGHADGRVELLDDGVRVSLGSLEAVARGLPIQAKGGVLTFREGGTVSAHDVRLSSTAGSVRVDGDVTGRTPSSLRGEARLRARDLHLGRLREAFAPELPPISGSLAADLHMVRRGHSLVFDGELVGSLEGGIRRLRPLDFTTRFDIGHGKLVASGHVHSPPGIRASGVFDYAVEMRTPADVLDVAAWKRLDFDEALLGGVVALRDFDLRMAGENLARRRDLGGRADIVLQADAGARAIDLSIALRGLVAPGVRGLDAQLDGRWDRKGLAMTLGIGGGGTRWISGDLRLAAGLSALLRGARLAEAPVEAKLVASEVSLADLGDVFPSLRKRAQGKLSLEATLRGTPADPSATLMARVDGGRYLGIEYRDLEARARLNRSRLEAMVVAHQGDGGRLELNATVNRLAANQLNARFAARDFDLGFVASMSAATKSNRLAGAGGKLDADVYLTSQGARREATGTLSLRHGSIYTPDGIAGQIRDLDAEVHMSGGRLIIDKLSGTSGAGKLHGGAELELDGSLALKSFKAHLVADRVPVTASSLLTTVSVDGEISGRAGEDEWNIEATARHTRVRLPDKARSGAKLHPTGDLSDVVYLDVDDLIRRTALLAITGSPEFGGHDGSAVRLSLETPGGVRVSGNEIDLLVASKLRVLLRGGMTFIGGSVETQRGFIQLFDRRYDVIRANVSFDESEPNNAKLDIKLSHEFQTTTLYVTVGGTLDKPTLELFADPGSYDKPQLLGILMGGDPDDPDVGQAQTYGEQATTAVSNALLGQLQGIVKLPVDKLSVTVGEGSDAQTTRFEVGKWITDSLFLGYIYRLNAPDDKNLNEAQIEYRIGPRWLLEAFFGDRGVAGAEVIWSKRF